MHSITAKRLLVVGLCLAATALAMTSDAHAKKKKQEPIESYSGHYINPNPGRVRGSNFVDMQVFRWTTDEERNALAQDLAAKGSDGLVTTLRDDTNSVGTVRLPGTIAYDLKYARATDTEKGRQIVLMTDRPVSMGELRYNARTLDYGLTIIEFLMPSDGGEGEGQIIAGAELSIDNNKRTIENVSLQPLKLAGVKTKKKKN